MTANLYLELLLSKNAFFLTPRGLGCEKCNLTHPAVDEKDDRLVNGIFIQIVMQLRKVNDMVRGFRCGICMYKKNAVLLPMLSGTWPGFSPFCAKKMCNNSKNCIY